MLLFKKLFLLRIAIAFILLMHSLPGMFNNGVNDFGNLYLNKNGFAPLGLLLAWAIKISHVACAIALMVNRWLLWLGSITIIILLAGIGMVHYPEGWYVVGAGRNGVEFNVLLIAALLTVMFYPTSRKQTRY